MKKTDEMYIWAIGIVVTIIIIVNFSSFMEMNVSGTFQYLEDFEGTYTFDEIKNGQYDNLFITQDDDVFSFGKNHSTHWIHVSVHALDYALDHILIFNPTVSDVELYYPINGNYIKKTSGWNSKMNDSDYFFFPSFEIQDPAAYEDMYIRVYSPFTQNYTLMFMSDQDYSIFRVKNFMMIGILFGVFISIIIYNVIAFIELKEESYIYYLLYVVTALVYQFNLAGLYTVFRVPGVRFIMENTITLSFLSMFFSLLFFRKFFNTKTLHPRAHIISRFFSVVALLGLLTHLFETYILGYPLFVNTFAHMYIIVMTMFQLTVAAYLYGKGEKQAKFYLIGWGVIFIGLVISVMRHSGTLPNNEVTLNVLLFTAAIEAMFISAAIFVKVKYLIDKKIKAEEMAQAAEKMALSSELSFYQAQIKPHFLFNALNVIASIAITDNQKTRQLILDLSQFLRKSFDFNHLSKLVSLDEEIDFVEAYFRIEQTRFKGQLHLEIDLEDYDYILLPRLVLQPLVENAVIHGILKNSNQGIITIVGRKEPECYRIKIIDNGTGIQKEEIDRILNEQISDSGVGIKNINERLRRMFGTGLIIKSEKDKGTQVEICIPYNANK